MDTWYQCEVLERKPLSNSVISLKLAYAASHTFLPGQFVMLDLPISGDFSTRSYSIASAPNTEGWIELCIVLKQDGAGTPYLFEDVQAGSVLKVSDAQGRFIIEDGEEPVCLISTGTGIAPFRSFIQHVQNRGIDREVHLIFGNRTESDILYEAEWSQLVEAGKLSFYPVLSRASESWSGVKGYVHEVYPKLAESNPNWIFYLCGWSTMVKETKNNLKALGFSRKQLKFELYD
ncbi:MAG: oxidoreductase [Bacteroidetes bacterium]|nr:MAG: oxidoreductase [Bacteroidota bacterium]